MFITVLSCYIEIPFFLNTVGTYVILRIDNFYYHLLTYQHRGLVSWSWRILWNTNDMFNSSEFEALLLQITTNNNKHVYYLISFFIPSERFNAHIHWSHVASFVWSYHIKICLIMLWLCFCLSVWKNLWTQALKFIIHKNDWPVQPTLYIENWK